MIIQTGEKNTHGRKEFRPPDVENEECDQKRFFTALAGKELNKVTVREISDLADINRATFYHHYLDVYDLYDKVEQEILIEWNALILSLEKLNSKDYFTGLVDYIYDNRDVFAMVFSPNIPGALRMKILTGIRKRWCKKKAHSEGM